MSEWIGLAHKWASLCPNPRKISGFVNRPDDNPTVGIILHSQRFFSSPLFGAARKRAIVRFQTHKLVLPTEEELRKELDRERAELAERKKLT